MRLCACRAFEGLCLEAVDEALHVLAGGFLLLGKGGIERAFHRARLDKRVVAAGVEKELAVLEMQDEFGCCVQQSRSWLTISTGAAIALQEILKPQHAFEVEIVRRLVEQQEVRCGEQDRRERGHAYASRRRIRSRGAVDRQRRTRDPARMLAARAGAA